jgi:hypothetical protein
MSGTQPQLAQPPPLPDTPERAARREAPATASTPEAVIDRPANAAMASPAKAAMVNVRHVRPMSELWSKADASASDALAVSANKHAQQRRAGEDAARTIQIMVWCSVRPRSFIQRFENSLFAQDNASGVEHVVYPHVVTDWPRFKLSDVTALVHDLELDNKSFVQHFAEDIWQRITLQNVCHATLHKRSLILVHRSFRDRLDLTLCERLDAEVARQTTLTRGKCRALADDDLPAPPAQKMRIEVKEGSRKCPCMISVYRPLIIL